MSDHDYTAYRDYVTVHSRDRAAVLQLGEGPKRVKGKVPWPVFHAIERYSLIVNDGLSKALKEAPLEEVVTAEGSLDGVPAQGVGTSGEPEGAQTQSVGPAQTAKARRQAANREAEYDLLDKEAMLRWSEGSTATAIDANGVETWTASGFQFEERGYKYVVDLESDNGRPLLCSRFMKARCPFGQSCSMFHPRRDMSSRESWTPPDVDLLDIRHGTMVDHATTGKSAEAKSLGKQDGAAQAKDEAKGAKKGHAKGKASQQQKGKGKGKKRGKGKGEKSSWDERLAEEVAAGGLSLEPG
jgi:hypothetical protein